MEVREGTTHRRPSVEYRCVGRGGIPLLVLHGGPGAGHDLSGATGKDSRRSA